MPNLSEIVVLLFVFLLAVIMGETINLHFKEKDLQFYRTQLQILENESKVAEDRNKKAQEQALKNLKEDENAITELMRTRVSNDCQAAMQWGLNQVKRIR